MFQAKKMVSTKKIFILYTVSILFQPVYPQSVAPSKTKKIHFIGQFAMSGAWPGGLSCLPSALMALGHVNSREDILRNYELVMHVNDTECEGGKGTDVMYWQLYRPPIKTMVFADGCSIVSEPTTRASKHWNMVMLSWAAASPALSDKNIYPRFLRMASPDQLMNPGRIAMLREFNWKKVAAISETFALFSAVTDDFILRIPDFNITMITSEIFTDDPSLQVQNLKKHDARIILLGSYEENAAKVMCEAYKHEVYGAKYVWIYPSWYSQNWWEKFNIGCTKEELVIALEGSFATGFMMANTVEERGIAGLTSKEYAAMFDKIVPPGPDRVGIGEWYNTYDGVWAIALTFNKTIERLAEMGKTLDDFTYDNKEIADIIQETMYGVEFLGVRGPVFFDENGDSFLPMEITQLQDGMMKRVGLYSPSEDTLSWTSDIKWLGGSVPRDSTTYIIELTYVSAPVYIAVCSFASVGILIAIFLLTFNIVYRKYRMIKMSSPVMNNIILAGCILSYLTVFIQELSDQYVELLCKVRTLTVMVGFSLSVGALFAKTWRVYVIFTNKTKKVILKDYQLVLIVGVIVGVDVVIFVIREFIAPLYVEIQVAVTEEYNDGDLIVQKEIMICKSDYGLYFQGVIYGFKGLMLIFGAFLAWQTRKVNIPALNDSQYIGMCIYNVAVLSILGVILIFVLDRQVQLQYVLTSGFLIFGTTIIQLIIFIPKVLKFRDAKNQVEEEGSETGTQVGKTPGTMTTVLEDNKEMDSLKKENESLKEELAKVKDQLKKTEGELSDAKKKLDHK